LTSVSRPSTDSRLSPYLEHDLLPHADRPSVQGKFLAAGGEKLYVKGVTYGTFATDDRGIEQHDADQVRADFEAMAANEINAIRTYTVPPRWLLDIAEEQGHYVLVGVPWEQHVTFLDDRRLVRGIERRVRDAVQMGAGHSAVLGYTVGNEIPAPIVRWHGRREVERFLHRLYSAAKDEDPDALVTYVNYPSTEYLDLPFLDFVGFNVYLEEPELLAAYLARLQNLAGDRPLVMAEMGLDSRRNGVDAQAESLAWQIGTAFEAGCAGAFAFAWTDEWHRGGVEIEDWDFGLVDRQRRAKPALTAVRAAFDDTPFPSDMACPCVSVVVCSCNGARTIGETCEALLDLDYPDYEVIVIDDGSQDATGAIASRFGFKVVSTENRGLSAARNTGLEAATGEIVAYVDDDAAPDPHWLRYLVHTFETTEVAAVGGPNIPPVDDPPTAACVARAPGGPIHVLLSDTEAEHIPGCNLAFRRDALMEIGGFDEGFTMAGDDVDVCWRIRDRSWKIAFNPAAMVWHRRRDTVRGYLRQQRGYGRAEALLERKWPQKHNVAGHVTWAGRIYGDGSASSLVQGRTRVRYGRWGTGLFQRLYTPEPTALGSLPLMPDWLLVVAGLGLLSSLALIWEPLLLVLPFFALAVALTVFDAALSARRSWLAADIPWREKLLTMFLFLAQPAARLWGRFQYGLHPGRRLEHQPLALPVPSTSEVWSERSRSVTEWVSAIEDGLWRSGAAVVIGGTFDRWELEVQAGLLGRARLRTAVEEHGGGRQLVRFRIMPRVSRFSPVVLGVLGVPAVAAALSGAVVAASVLGAVAVIVAARTALELGAATGLLREASQLVEGVGPEDLSGERATLACPRGRAQRSARDDRT
jgi:GT2 family glycosyltransferase